MHSDDLGVIGDSEADFQERFVAWKEILLHTHVLALSLRILKVRII